MGALNEATIDFYLDVHPEFIFGFSPELLGTVCRKYPKLTSLFETKLVELSAALDPYDVTEYERPGTFSMFDDADWLRHLSKILTKYKVKVPRTTLAAHGFESASEEEFVGIGEDATLQQEASKLAPVYLPALDVGQFMQPTLFARGGLFRAPGARNVARQSWPASRPRVISHFSGLQRGRTTLTYIGEELWTGDQELWVSLLRFGATTALGQDVTVRFLDVLHSMPGRGTTGSSPRERVRSEGNRLKHAGLTLRSSDPAVIRMLQKCLPENNTLRDASNKNFIQMPVSLLEAFTTSTDSITFRISRELCALFGSNLYTWYDLDTYYSLPAKGLSRRLYLLYNSHYDCYPLTLLELTEYLGVRATVTRNVKANLEEAHEQLIRIGQAVKFEYRNPTLEERASCTAPCFVVTRPARSVKVAHLDEMEIRVV